MASALLFSRSSSPKPMPRHLPSESAPFVRARRIAFTCGTASDGLGEANTTITTFGWAGMSADPSSGRTLWRLAASSVGHRSGQTLDNVNAHGLHLLLRQSSGRRGSARGSRARLAVVRKRSRSHAEMFATPVGLQHRRRVRQHRKKGHRQCRPSCCALVCSGLSASRARRERPFVHRLSATARIRAGRQRLLRSTR